MTVWLWLKTWEGRNKTPQQKRGNPACIFSNAREGPKKSKSSKMDWLQMFWNRNHWDLRTVSTLHACACCWTSFAWQAHSILMTQLTPGTSKSLRSKEHQGSAIPFDSETVWLCDYVLSVICVENDSPDFCPLRLRQISAISVRSWEVLTGDPGMSKRSRTQHIPL